MDPLEWFLPMVIPCLFREHLPVDTLPIIFMLILFFSFSFSFSFNF